DAVIRAGIRASAAAVLKVESSGVIASSRPRTVCTDHTAFGQRLQAGQTLPSSDAHDDLHRRSGQGAVVDPSATGTAHSLGSVEERRERGRQARADLPRSSHGEWSPSAERTDPIEILEAQAESRVPELVPIRYGRMMVSPATFYRGAAAVMA